MEENLAASEMEDDQKATETKFHDVVFADLMNEIKNNPLGASFSYNLRQRLEGSKLRASLINTSASSTVTSVSPSTEVSPVNLTSGSSKNVASDSLPTFDSSTDIIEEPMMAPKQRRALVSRTRDGRPPLLLAAQRGHVEATEYLVHVCNADLEQRGLYEVTDDRSKHSVTALWCAAVGGRLGVLRALLEAGADADAASDTGSTPLRSACFMSRADAAELLLAHGADPHRANHNGGTCLINAVQSASICAMLLDAGARPNVQDAQGKTALHYAAQEHRLDAARLLLQRGADPALRCRAGDDALTAACIKGAAQIVKLIVGRGKFPVVRVADAYELLGATQLDELNDVAAALATWHHATVLREQLVPPRRKRWADCGAACGAACRGGGEGAGALREEGARAAGGREWRTRAELLAAADDMELLRANALLVVLRVLGPHHRETVFRFMYRGAAYADAFQYQRCIELWGWALRARVATDTMLCVEACHTAAALARLLLDAEAGRLARLPAGEPRFEDAARALELLVDAARRARRLLAVRPQCQTQLDCNDTTLRCLTHVLHVALRLARGAACRRRVADASRRALDAGVRTAAGETLLHLVVSSLNTLGSSYFSDDIAPSSEAVFPSAALARLLLRCGAAPDALTDTRSTPLHIAALPHNFSNELVELLLEAGAHLDQRNKRGESALEQLRAAAGCSVRPLRHVTLQCLAARALAEFPPLPQGVVPPALHAVLQQHRPAPKRRPAAAAPAAAPAQ